ncbi:GNAT family N-acetyltransferase [Usitatibacter palustris]|uniref:N-acetyltransferase domain-containing protein n=1 Tax=Usitatibacter palustris TaxID=2732487 RepID=A0A6M4HDX6_9PROT|nr:GNAT family N-acetyltransferase [Usitatibacter palustris]QJR16177.1 hypothetical protein DSM104440_03006 [Usitatibacter palustris]
MEKAPAITLRPSRESDLAFITALERHVDNVKLIGQWEDAEHLAAIHGERGRSHEIIERDGSAAGYLISYDCVAEGAGIYVKRLLVAEKERGTGKAALTQFVDRAMSRADVTFVWLHVRHDNLRAQAVYRGLGFESWEQSDDERMRLDAAAETAGAGNFRMRLLK